MLVLTEDSSRSSVSDASRQPAHVFSNPCLLSWSERISCIPRGFPVPQLWLPDRLDAHPSRQPSCVTRKMKQKLQDERDGETSYLSILRHE